MKQGAVYQPTQVTKHINDYINNHQLDLLYAQLLPDALAKKISPTFTGSGDGQKLLNDGITTIRIYQAPMGNSQEIARFKTVMDEVYKLYGIRVMVGDNLGIYTANRNNPYWIEDHVRQLGSLYGSEPWLASFLLGDENEQYLRSGFNYSSPFCSPTPIKITITSWTNLWVF